MEGLTAKVFRTYNASITLERELEKMTFDDSMTVAEKMLIEPIEKLPYYAIIKGQYPRHLVLRWKNWTKRYGIALMI
jgi:hypothetical protein